MLADFPDACDALAAQKLGPDNQILAFAPKNVGQDASAGVGTYSVMSESMSAAIVYYGTDASCRSTLLAGTAGSLTLTAVHDQRFDGSFQVTMKDGSHASGSFRATECAAIGTEAFHHGTLDCSLR